jgi:hypothetical protein
MSQPKLEIQAGRSRDLAQALAASHGGGRLCRCEEGLMAFQQIGVAGQRPAIDQPFCLRKRGWLEASQPPREIVDEAIQLSATSAS